MNGMMRTFGAIGETSNLFSPLINTQYAATPASTPPTTSSDKEMIKALQKLEQLIGEEIVKSRV